MRRGGKRQHVGRLVDVAPLRIEAADRGIIGQEHRERAVLEVRASNEAARCLYEQAGFHHLAARAAYYTNPIEDAILMGMDLLEAASSE